jgi:hypothetical protein
MSLADLTKQVAQQAILSATSKDPAPAQQSDSPAAVFLAQIGAMQKPLKEDEELLVLFQSGPERIRVLEIFIPSRFVAVLTGIDPERRQTRIISSVEALQLVCKVIKTQPGAKPVRLNLVTPK